MTRLQMHERDVGEIKMKDAEVCKRGETKIAGKCVNKNKETLREYKPQAVLTLSNLGGVSIQVSDDGDGVRYQWYDNKPSRWQPIKYTSGGRPYFVAYKRKFYIDEFMRTNIR